MAEDRRIINTALCSFGMSGLVFHAPLIAAHPGFNLYGVWERSKKEAQQIYPAIVSFSSLEEMLNDPSIDLVVVNTPNHTHFEFAKKALRAQKHVLVEKAFTVTVTEAMELKYIAEQQNKLLSVFQNRRYDSDFKTVNKVIAEGELGNVLEAHFRFDRYKPQLSAKEHKEKPLPGSGLLHDLGPHLVDQALYLFGMPASVFGYTRTHRPNSQVNDFFQINLFYASHAVQVSSSLMVKEEIPAYIIHGTNGSFIKQRGDVQEDVLKTGQKPGGAGWGIEHESAAGILNIIQNGNGVRKPVPTLAGNYMEFYDALYTSITQNKPLPVTANDGINVMKIIEAVLDSRGEKTISISP